MKDNNNVSKRHFRNDIILIAVILLAAVVGMVYLFNFRPTGDTVKITVDGKSEGVYLLSDDTVVDIRTGENESQLNRLIIKDGKAYVESATCPDGICVNHRPIFRDGESIVCLPNKVVVSVITQNSSDNPDIVI